VKSKYNLSSFASVILPVLLRKKTNKTPPVLFPHRVVFPIFLHLRGSQRILKSVRNTGNESDKQAFNENSFDLFAKKIEKRAARIEAKVSTERVTISGR